MNLHHSDEGPLDLIQPSGPYVLRLEQHGIALDSLGDGYMKRREFIALLGGTAVVWPLAGRAQQVKVARVGILTPAETDQTPIFEAFRRGLRERGYTIGRDVIIEFRSARGDSAALPKLAAELVSLPVDVILTDGAAAARAAKDATGQIPIIMGTTGADPVELGLVDSLRRPGRNLTGFTLLHGELSAKRLDVLRTAFPNATTITVLLNPHPGSEANFRAVQEAANKFGPMTLRRVEAARPDNLRQLRPESLRGDAPILVLPDAMFWNHRREILALIAAARVPAVYPEREYADDGSLIAYGPNVPDNFRRAADYVDQVVKGAKPGELPIQEPAKFDFIVNLKTANALGITIPPAILLRADQVIE